VADAARDAGTPCGVCGELAGDFAMALVLVGMGYQSLSMSPFFLAEVRYAIRQVSYAEARELAKRALDAKRSDEVRALLAQARDRLHARLMRDRAGTSNPTQP